MKHGYTLIELLIVVLTSSLLFGAATFGYIVVLKNWGIQDTTLEVREDLRQGIEKMLRDLRPAKAISVVAAEDAIRYTVDEGGTDNNYIFYLYHPSESWVPAWNQTVYTLKRTALTGGISGTFTYGDGTIYVKEVKPPAADVTDMSSSGNVLTIELTVTKSNVTYHLLEKVRPRNL